ncbi:BglG family transcription antiterminator [Bacillus sp. DNRA2]|uniref:BglG family transcription antiterminator n=1 Tax=Bacillus sp. DNRA2 TaxID=2723053 RepID=UPI00145F5283|nr:PRD domain-containing protein [Bacillus sp. DNRA2]NMD68734.1 BglG family transcription antiterminator [Bacillus sp. DNRA2]
MSDFLMDEKVIKIIELARKKPFCTLDYLAEQVGVSTRTIRNYIKQINSDLSDIAFLENEKGKGFHLQVSHLQKFEDLMEKLLSEKIVQDSPQKRIAFIIERLINHDGPNTLDELAFLMNIGRTTLVNELKKASVALESYNLFIQGKQNSGMYLSGNELDLRFFILENVYDYLYGAYPLDEDIKAEIIRVARKHDLEATTLTRLMHSVIVMLDRVVKNHPIEAMNEKFNKLLGTQEHKIALEIVAAIQNTLPISIPEAEVVFITIPIAGRRTPTNNRTMADIAITEEIVQLLDTILEQVGFEKEIMLENETLFKDLQYHLTFMINRLMFNVRIKNPILDDVKEKYPVALKMAEIAGKVVEKEFGLVPSIDELGYLAFYFGVFIAQTELKAKTLRRVAVICGTGRGTAKLVSMQLQRVLSYNTEIDVFSEIEVTKELLDQYDMVFTTVKLAIDTITPTITVNEIFDERSVSQQIEKVTYLQKFRLKENGNHNSIIRLLTSHDKFFILDSRTSYQENVCEMVDEMVNNGYYDSGFKERLEKREEKGSMAFDQYIALPHTSNLASDHVELAIGVFPESVIANENEIKLVFLLGIPKSTDYDASLLVKIYDEIIKIATDKQLVAQLANTISYQEFSKLLENASQT